MGDVFISYDEYGKKYLRRIVYLTVLLYIVMGIAFVLFMADILILLLAVILTAAASLAYALYFIHKHPPLDYPENLSGP
jgi:hypothetical protein